MSEQIVVTRADGLYGGRDVHKEGVAMEVSDQGVLTVLGMGAKVLAVYASGRWTDAKRVPA